MTLVTCPDCQSAVSQYASACPSCGRPLQPAAYPPAGARARPFVETPAPPFVETPAPPYGAQTAPPYGAQPSRPYAEQPAPPYGAQPAAPYGAPAAYPYQARAADPFAAQKSSVQLAYALYAGSYVFGPLAIVAVVISYMRRKEVPGTWMAAHYDWLIDTFWMSLAVGLAGGIVTILMMAIFFPLGFLAIMGLVLFGLGWPIYRLIVGWTALGEGRLPEGKLSGPRW
ncbi:MAG TPA: hypothetical protein VFJ16_04710 [Longimicrobium sp.]|nr:hypothetical protein [Longimicrobium sp.]